MIAQGMRILSGVIVSFALVVAPGYASALDSKHRTAQSRHRSDLNVRGARWDRHVRTTPPDSTDQFSLDSSNNIPLDGHAIESGIASWYGWRHQGRITSSGRRFDQNELTAAHRWLPLGSRVRVRLVGTPRTVDVMITDRPGTRRRIIDLSRAAARTLGMIRSGTALVTISHL